MRKNTAEINDNVITAQVESAVKRTEKASKKSKKSAALPTIKTIDISDALTPNEIAEMRTIAPVSLNDEGVSDIMPAPEVPQTDLPAVEFTVNEENVAVTEKAAAPEKAPKQPRIVAPKMTRIAASVIEIHKHNGKYINLDTMVENADDAYRGLNAPNRKEQRMCMKFAILTLETLGMIEDRGKGLYSIDIPENVNVKSF